MSIQDAVEEVYARRADPHDWRVEQYLRMGYGYGDALALALTRDADGFFIWWGDVLAMVEGATGLLEPDAARAAVACALL